MKRESSIPTIPSRMPDLANANNPPFVAPLFEAVSQPGKTALPKKIAPSEYEALLAGSELIVAYAKGILSRYFPTEASSAHLQGLVSLEGSCAAFRPTAGSRCVER